jgi:non-specific serine/threonine protein kinase
MALRLDLSDAVVDVVAFDAAIARNDHASLEEAVALYRGPLLEECVEEWAFPERQFREHAYLDARKELADIALAEGNPAVAAGHLRRALLLDPLRETLSRSLMRALVASGDATAALLAYRELRIRLERELETGPDPETTALYEEIRTNLRRCAGGASSVGPPFSAPTSSVATQPPHTAPKNNLRVPLTSFVGREQEMSTIKRLLFAAPSPRFARAGTRLLTLTGAGGCGKSRLAVETAADLLEEFTDGVWLVELASLSEGAFVTQTVASALGVREQPGRSLIETLIEHLRPRQLLLLLDNCEHIVPACAHLVQTLTGHCPHLWMLVTSRVPLGLAGETLYPVPALSLPEPGNSRRPGPSRSCSLARAAQSEAVCLFVERAAAGMPGLTLTETNAAAVTRICCRLDGLPLAIELVAARARAMSLPTLAERLEEGFRLVSGGGHTLLPHHQSLRASIEWSYALLPEPERALLRRLSVFAGGWTLEAAESVCGESDVLELLVSLVDKSLVDYADADGVERYRLLETVRQYAAERLIEAGEEAIVRSRHLAFHVDLAETAEPHLLGPDGVRWLNQLEREHDNLRTAMEWSIVVDEADAGMRLAGALFRFWETRGYYREGQEWYEAVLAMRGASTQTVARATVLLGAGSLAHRRNSHETVTQWIEESLAISRELGDLPGIGMALNALGNVVAERGDFARAQSCYQEAIALHRSISNQRELARALGNLGWLLRLQGDYEGARALQEESLVLRRATGHKRGAALALCHLGVLARYAGDYASARRYDEESLALARELNDPGWISQALGELGNLAIRESDFGAARALLDEALALRRALGSLRDIAEVLESMAWASAERGLERHATPSDPRARGRNAPSGEPISPWQRRLLERAARLFGAAEALRERSNLYAAPPGESTEWETALTGAREALGEAAFTAAWAEGRQMTTEQACDDALRDVAVPTEAR